MVGSNMYEVHIDFNSYVLLCTRTMIISDASECEIQSWALREVMTYFVMPVPCYWRDTPIGLDNFKTTLLCNVSAKKILDVSKLRCIFLGTSD